MIITTELLQSKGACNAGMRWFADHWPDGVEMQAALDQAVKDDHADYADWLLDKFGATADVVRIDGDLIAEGAVYFAGSVIVSGTVRVGRLRASWSIESGGSIKSGESIESGASIKSGESIESGWSIKSGWSIESGGSIKSGESIESGWSIKSGWSIESGGSIKSGESIEAGSGIEAGWGIEAGDGYGIFAGLKIKIANWIVDAKVIAKIPPKNVMTGHVVIVDDQKKEAS